MGVFLVKCISRWDVFFVVGGRTEVGGMWLSSVYTVHNATHSKATRSWEYVSDWRIQFKNCIWRYLNLPTIVILFTLMHIASYFHKRPYLLFSNYIDWTDIHYFSHTQYSYSGWTCLQHSGRPGWPDLTTRGPIDVRSMSSGQTGRPECCKQVQPMSSSSLTR